jgi:hypothetical protein
VYVRLAPFTTIERPPEDGAVGAPPQDNVTVDSVIADAQSSRFARLTDALRCTRRS